MDQRGYGPEDLSLPDNQDALIAAVAAANPKTIVVLETGTAVTMPWLDQVGAVPKPGTPAAKAQRLLRMCSSAM
jgi:beta-glucosidase